MSVQKVSFKNTNVNFSNSQEKRQLTQEERLSLLEKQKVLEFDRMADSILLGLGVGAVSAGVFAVRKKPNPVYNSITPALAGALAGLFIFAFRTSMNMSREYQSILNKRNEQ